MKPKGIPVPWLLRREVPLEAGDTFYCGLDGQFPAGEVTIKFIERGIYQHDLILVAFKCSREGEFDLIYDMWYEEEGA